MSDQQDSPDVARLIKANAELSRSLGKCRELVDECRAKLAANCNEPFLFPNDGQVDEESDLA